ncbi:hypothetical protein D9758_010698 [Tetrapyrgos nigripes]|uniref:Uncharacterized protein n=1 Tax=Tetrapyrgos nigripes TaxID=182062 RepID=A0A8H5GG96_9AGAR|nr:hypothetical protein D9758_010698 [Tetrapyrgos nigripes]
MAGNATESLLQIDNSPTYRAMMIALLLAALLCGVAAIQAILYFCVNKSEPMGHRIAVGSLWLLNSLHLCFFAHATFDYVLNQPRIGLVPYIWSFKVHLFAEVFILSATKVMYLIRIWKLRKLTTAWVPIALAFPLILEFVLGTLLAANIASLSFIHELINAPFEWAGYVFMSLTSATDILIGGVLVYALAKSGSNLNWTNSSWTMLSAYLLNTGIITGIFSLMTLISFSTGNVWSTVFIISQLFLPQREIPSFQSIVSLLLTMRSISVYVNCFLSMMNASFYFQTKTPIRQFSFPYFPTSSSLSEDRFEIPILNEHREGRGLRSYTSTSLGSTMMWDQDSPTGKKPENDFTINEVGLPLFTQDTKVKEEPPKKKVPMRIQVLTTKEEHSTVIPMHRYNK